MPAPLRVLAVATYPELGASTRYRVLQYVPLLAAEHIDMDVRPFLSNRAFAGLYDRSQALRSAAGVAAGIWRRAFDAARLGSYDVLFVQREAALVGPPVLEWLARRRIPIVLDLDDATYLERPSDVFGGLARRLKWPGKPAQLVRWADHVTCGNPGIAAYVRERGIPATIVPTIVDVDRFVPRGKRHEDVHQSDVVIGWIGTHSTYVYFRTLLPALQRLAATHRFKVRVVGAGVSDPPASGVNIELKPWRLDTELDDLQSFDLAVYPIVQEEWAEGKSGFKAVQYLACGIPFVASPVGIVSQIGIPGVTHLEARSEDEWVAALGRLVTDAALRATMSREGRAYAVREYSTRHVASVLANVFRAVVEARRRS